MVSLNGAHEDVKVYAKKNTTSINMEIVFLTLRNKKINIKCTIVSYFIYIKLWTTQECMTNIHDNNITPNHSRVKSNITKQCSLTWVQ